MSLTTKQKQELRKVIRELAQIRGRHTELVSIYIPADYDLNKIVSHIQQEIGTASNIKDAKTRKNVTDSLEKAVHYLRLYKKTPENGLAVFVGNVAAQEGKTDLKVWGIEPPEPIKTRIYRCDQYFLLDLLEDMLEHKEIYGLIVLDRREATLGFLKGTSITATTKLTSGIPGKHRAGGQCLSEDTLIMKSDGDVIEIKDSHNPLTIISENFNLEKTEETPIIAKWENKKQLFNIKTCYPRLEIKTSKDHTFFVRTENGIEEKPLHEIKKGTYLVMPEKINLNLEYQKLNFNPIIKNIRNLKKINIPKFVNEDMARSLGYYLGDGSYEVDRLTFFEQRKEVAEYYKNLLEKVFGIEVKLIFRTSKNYWQLRIYSRVVSQLFKQIIQPKDKTLGGKIPSIILKSPDSVLASFISGFFDAEGYVQKTRVALGINNKLIVKQLQFILLRLGIVSSINEYDNRRNPYSNKVRYTLAIDDIESIKKFKENIGFSSTEKQEKLKKMIATRSNKNKVRQIIVNGKEIAKILRNSGHITYKLGWSNFLNNKRQLNKELFKEKISNNIFDEELKKRLLMFYNSNLIVVKILKILPLDKQKTIDVETKNHNFIANGLIVHNSSQRFERLIEGMAKDFYKRIANAANKEFLGLKLKGILIGGPGQTKETFLNYINEELKNKVIAKEDITYTDESGLHDLVDKCRTLLIKETITEEKKVIERFLTILSKESGKVAYGEKEVKNALEMGAVEILLLLEDLDDAIIEKFETEALNYGTEVRIISTDTRESMQLKELGGIAAILRYSIK